MTHQTAYDVTMTVHPDMLIWPGNAGVEMLTVKSIACGDSSNLSELRIGTHTGTHVDAPRHFLDGASGIDALPPDTLLGPARLFQLPDADCIDRRVLDTLELDEMTRVLFGTRNTALLHKGEFDPSFVFLAEDAAQHLVDLGIRLVGIDYLSVEKYRAEGHRTHRLLLEAGVLVVEGLDLSGVPAGDYELICMPLKLKDADGAPARVFLRTPV